MNTKNILLYLIALLAFCSCDDMFTPADENTRQEDAMYVESEYANGLLMYAYSRLPYQTTTQTDIATDDAVTNNKASNLLIMASNGTWASDNDPMSQWNSCKDGIQYANKFLTIVEHVKWAPSAESKQQMFIDRMKGESFAIRAILNYYLLMAHGGYADDNVLYGVPLLVKPEDASSDFNQPRATFAACVQQCFDDCDSAMALLPVDYKDISSNKDVPEKYRQGPKPADYSNYNSIFGISSRNRISGRVAEAVKAQVALLAASPAFREQSGVTSEKAAELCARVLMNNEDKDPMGFFDPTGNVDWYAYQYKSMIETSASTDLLWHTDRSNNNSQEKENFPPSLFGNARVNPSQNLVDAFPMNNGLPITDPDSGYDPQNPYANRDNRLANCIIYNGAEFKKNTIFTGVNMKYGKDEVADNINADEKSTRTGYYLKKLLREDASANPSSQLNQQHVYPRIRYTEIFLAFAEAINDAIGPNDHIKIKVMEDGKEKEKEFNLSAYDVIKAIRERGGVGKDEYGRPVPGGDKYIEQAKKDKAKMTELIRNERRLELCFENKRFWDLRRWNLPLNESIKGMMVERINPDDSDSPLKYTVIPVEDRLFMHKDGSYMWYGPIPKNEVLKWSNLKQNKGWL